ncbi:MAG: metallophosphoesterase [Anaerolineae bacterium]|nr:metallophosphoesterase [Anaerolineae bacterium]
MARRRGRRSTGQILLYILSGVVVLSMALGYAFLAAPSPQPTPTLPPAARTANRTPAPTAGPSATPTSLPTITPVPLTARPTLDPSATAYSFAVIGETAGNPDVYRALLRQIEADGNRFLIHLGNMTATGTAADFQAWREFMADFPLPVYTVPGNQDAPDGSLANYLAFTGAPGAHYSFDIGLVHFAVADASRGYLGAEETAWLDADLAATQKPVKIVALHYPPFDPRGSSQVLTMGNEAFTTLMRHRGVRYVFAGHIRAYDQSTRDGVIYVISGGGGAPLSHSEDQGGFYHYVRVSVNGTDVQTEVRKLAQ